MGGSVLSGEQRPLKLLASGVFCRGARRARPAPQHLSRYTDDRFDRLLRLRPDPAPSTEVSRTRRPRRPVRLVLFNIPVISCCSAAAALLLLRRCSLLLLAAVLLLSAAVLLRCTMLMFGTTCCCLMLRCC